MKKHPTRMREPASKKAYEARVAELEALGLTTSDAQGVVDCEELFRKSNKTIEPTYYYKPNKGDK